MIGDRVRLLSRAGWLRGVPIMLCVLQQAVSAAERRTALSLAQDLVVAAFPELAREDSHVVITVDTDFSSKHWDAVGMLAIAVRAPDHTRLAGDPPKERTVLIGHLVVSTASAKVLTASFKGDHVHSREMEELERILEGQGHWTVADVERELLKRNAQFPPSRVASLQSASSLGRVQRAFGSTRLVTPTFGEPPSASPIPGSKGPDPNWWVLLKRSATDCIFLVFEPIDGHFVRLGRGDCSGYN